MLFVEYGFRWLEPKCRLEPPAELSGYLNPALEQLLGGDTKHWRSFAPRAHELPLQGWLERRSQSRQT